MRTALENAEYYAACKSQQDMVAALAACTPDFELCSPPFGGTMKGREENITGMAAFFSIFPDYTVEASATLSSDKHVLMTGHVSLTPNFDILGIRGTAKTSRLAFSAAFTMRGSLLARETFILDLVDLCAQSGLPLDVACKTFARSVVASAA